VNSKLQNLESFFQCAPALSSLKLDFKRGAGEVKDWGVLFPPEKSIETLTNLTIVKSSFVDFIPKLPRTFPQLKHLSLLVMF
jgi:hypothetical protein